MFFNTRNAALNPTMIVVFGGKAGKSQNNRKKTIKYFLFETRLCKYSNYTELNHDHKYIINFWNDFRTDRDIGRVCETAGRVGAGLPQTARRGFH